MEKSESEKSRRAVAQSGGNKKGGPAVAGEGRPGRAAEAQGAVGAQGAAQAESVTGVAGESLTKEAAGKDARDAAQAAQDAKDGAVARRPEGGGAAASDSQSRVAADGRRGGNEVATREAVEKDLRSYLKGWKKLDPRRKRVRTLIVGLPPRPKGNAESVGEMIRQKIVPAFARLMKGIDGLQPATDVVRRIHERMAGGYRKMLQAYRRAGRAWESDGKGVGRALRDLQEARRQIRVGRQELQKLAKAYDMSVP